MNLTLAIDEDLVEKAREAARAQGQSLQALIRKYIAQLAGVDEGKKKVERMHALWRKSDALLKGTGGLGKFNREEVYAERLDRIGRKRG
jgi:hypothetical protein